MACDRSPTQTPTEPHRIRQRSSLVLAVACGVTCLLLLAAVVRQWADNPQPLFAAWLVFGLAVVWSLFVRPAVLLDDDGVTIRNIVRDIRIPWDQVSDVEFRWNLKVFVEDRGYTAWAITSQVERPKGASGGMLGSFMPGRFDKYASTKALPASPAQKVTASSVARLIDQVKEDHEESVARGALPATPNAKVRVVWVPLGVAILLVPAAAVLVLSLI